MPLSTVCIVASEETTVTDQQVVVDRRCEIFRALVEAQVGAAVGLIGLCVGPGVKQRICIQPAAAALLCAITLFALPWR
jgi:hypothetical protein